MKIEELIAGLRAVQAGLLTERNQHKEVISQIRAACAPTGGDTRDPDDGEAERIRIADEAIQGIDSRNAVIDAQVAKLEDEQKRDEAAEELAKILIPTGVGSDRRVGGARVLREEGQYSERKLVNGEVSWLSDAYNGTKRGDSRASERLLRHANEVEREGQMTERALATGALAGLVPPQYLIDLAAPVLRAGRPIANACNRHQLPDKGMTLDVPRGTTGASAAAQATQNTAVSSTDEVWTDLTIPVCTVAGQAPVSRQALERGNATDVIIFGDLARAYAAQLDNYVVNGSGGSGQPLGILSTSGIGAATAFGAAPTSTNQQLKIAGSVVNVTSAGAGIWPKMLFMHPRRWGWYTSLVDTTGRPLNIVTQMGPYNALAINSEPGKMGGDDDPITGLTIVGMHSSGLAVVSDLNIPTNVGTNLEDIIITADTQELHLWEDGDGAPQQLDFEQTAGNALTTTLVVYGYMAFTAGRYPACVSKIGGLDSTATFGLVAPAF